VSEFQLICAGAHREGKQLVTEAYPEGWHDGRRVARDEPAERVDGVRDGGGVARPVGDKQPVEIPSFDGGTDL
jgi:hypothetical protein